MEVAKRIYDCTYLCADSIVYFIYSEAVSFTVLSSKSILGIILTKYCDISLLMLASKIPAKTSWLQNAPILNCDTHNLREEIKNNNLSKNRVLQLKLIDFFNLKYGIKLI